MRAYRTRNSGFTLVEILIVVIILGILAAIVIPQFTNASEDARKSSLVSQLQTLRSQVELYKLQHRDRFPLSDLDDVTSDWDWDQLTTKTDEDGAAGGIYGPYLQSPSVNPLTNGSNVISVADDATALGTTGSVGNGSDPTTNDGFVFSQATGKIWAFAKDGTVYME
jgi:general secretion pathway protein G